MLLLSEIITASGRVPTPEAVEKQRSEQLEEVQRLRRLLRQSPQRRQRDDARQSAERSARGL